MLDLNAGADVSRWILSLPCEVNLPANCATEAAAHRTYCVDDRRRFARIVCRVPQIGAALQYATTFPSLPRPSAWHRVFLADVSRGGCGFLHSEPLYPGERMEILFAAGAQNSIEIVRCVRVDDRRFRIGAIFMLPSACARRSASIVVVETDSST